MKFVTLCKWTLYLTLCQDKLAELEMQQANLHELLASLKDPKDISGRLMEWHAKLGEAR